MQHLLVHPTLNIYQNSLLYAQTMASPTFMIYAFSFFFFFAYGIAAQHPSTILALSQNSPNYPPTEIEYTPLSTSKNSSHRWLYFYLGVLAGGTLASVFMIILFCFLRRRFVYFASSQRLFEKQEIDFAKSSPAVTFGDDISKIASLKVINLKDSQEDLKDIVVTTKKM